MKKKYFVGMTFRNIHFFAVFIILSYFLSGIVVYGTGLISDAIDRMLLSEIVDVLKLSVTTCMLILISMLLAFFKTVSGNMFSIRIQRQCRELTVKSLQTVKLGYIEKNSGTLITRLTSDIGDVGDLFSEIIPDIFQYAVTIITLSISIIIMDFRLILGIGLCYPIVLFISGRISKIINALAKKRRGKYDELTGAAQDAISGIAVERAYGLYKVLNQRIDNIAEDILKNEYARNRIQAVSNAISNLLRWLPNVVCFVFALMEVFSGNLSVGELLAFEVLFAKITDPISELPFRINDAREMLVSLNRIDDILNAPKESGGVQILNADYSGKNVIVLENASYWYDTNPDRRILDGLNLVFEKGKTTAIVGSSGAGKSTLFKLLCGFETLREGKYLFMGQDFSKLDIGAAREKIAIVTQNVFLFPDTVAENVAYGKSVASIKEIEEACREACIHDYIKSLPDGYETMVGERGANMSGGEKQRLSIARAILKDAPIILMDEPTSALDTGTETAVTNALDELRKVKEDKTIIIIAHRLSTIINADRIVVMEHGKIVETGTHRELLERGGVYAGLYARECSADY